MSKKIYNRYIPKIAPEETVYMHLADRMQQQATEDWCEPGSVEYMKLLKEEGYNSQEEYREAFKKREAEWDKAHPELAAKEFLTDDDI